MIQSLMSLSVCLIVLNSGIAFASDEVSNSSVSGGEVSGKTTYNPGGIDGILGNRKFEDTRTLTDPALRTSDGSLSRFSFKGSFGYSGPTFADLSAQNQPNPDGTAGNYAQRMTGNATANYRLDATHNLSAGTGITLNYPFAGTNQYSTNNPFVGYSFANRYDNLQMRNSAQLIQATIPNYTAIGERAGVSWFNGLVYQFTATKLALSLDSTAYYWMFSRGYQATDGFANKRPQTVQQYTIGTQPGLKYLISDNMNIYTNASFQWFNPRGQSGDQAVLWNRSVSTALGFGWAYSRDIYISPYLISYPNNMQADQTTINLSTTFSLL